MLVDGVALRVGIHPSVFFRRQASAILAAKDVDVADREIRAALTALAEPQSYAHIQVEV